MYNNRDRKKIFLFGILGMVLLLPYQVFGLELSEEIYEKIQSIYDGDTFGDYLNKSYNPEFSKDPFGDAMSNISDMSNKVKKSGEDYVKKSLDFDGCYMTNKEIRGILYYYITGYRADVTRSLKIEKGDYDSKKYEISKDKLDEYCSEFYRCMEKGPANKETKCMEFFQKTYKAGEFNEQIKQDVQTSQLGSDKYWNNSTDDSPYDVMEDLGVLSKLLYMEAQDPLKPVFYDVPSFSNSKKALNDSKNGIDSENKTSQKSGGGSNKNGEGKGSSSDPKDEEQQWENKPSNSPTNPITSDKTSEYDNLLEGLGAYTLTSDGSEFYTNLCDNREKVEVEEETQQWNEVTSESLDINNLSEEQYQEIVDYMLNAVDQYTSLSSEKEAEVDEIIGDKSDFGGEGSAERLQERIDQVKNCYDSCKGLRLDQKASCMVKCACGEIKSPIFNPKDTPGLGPIFMIKFCAVPAVDMRFSVGGKRIHSIEEGVREIYGVVDKLSREGRLGTWTQEYEFLDASTKRIIFADNIAFSIGIEFVNISNRFSKHSEQYEKKEIKKYNQDSQENFGVANKTDTTKGRNYYRIIQDEDSLNLGNINENEDSKAKSQLNAGREYSNNVNEDENAIRYTQLESNWDLWMKQQRELRNNVMEFTDILDNSAIYLKEAKDECKRN